MAGTYLPAMIILFPINLKQLLKLPVGNYKVSHRNTVREDKGYKGGTN
jgi:hypothetical protein